MSEINLPPRKRPARPASHEDAELWMPPTSPPPREKPVTAIAGIDKPLLYITITLSILGLVAVYSASATEAMAKYHNSMYFAVRQLIFFVLGFATMVGVSRIPHTQWIKIAKPIALVVIGLLIYTLASGVEAYGAERWIRIFGVQFQPSELGKISVLLLLTQALGKPPDKRNPFGLILNLGIIFCTLGLILKQPSLSMTLILSFVSATMIFISNAFPWPYLLLVGGGGATFIINKLMHTEYQLRRIQGWLNPWKDTQDTGYNLIQSLYAIGSGGLLGTGLGMSHQKLYYLPFQYTDFIFSIWAEEWGLLGCIILIGLFVALLYRGFTIASQCKSSAGQLLAMGITLMLAAQIGINLAVATGLFPVTGVTLPLISYGGTSVLVSLFMIGLLLNVSRYRVTVSHIAPTNAP